MTKVLVIEDSPAIRDEVLCALNFEGFETKCADEAEAGLGVAQTWHPDLVICDILLPKRSGYEVLETLRAKGDDAPIPFIFLSAKANRSDVRYGMNMGADDYITKPFQVEELLSAVKIQLKKRQRLQRCLMGLPGREVEKTELRDGLTGLPNRFALREFLKQALQPEPNNATGLLVVDIDNYRGVRDALSSDEAGTILREVAERLDASAGPHVYRVDSASFACVTTKVDQKRLMGDQARRVLRTLNAPFQTSLGRCYLNFSLGISLYPNPSRHADGLIANAEFAAAEARKAGRGYYRFYRNDLTSTGLRQLAIETHLRLAQQRGELTLHYQPKVDLAGHHTFGVEALMRWQSNDLGFMGPESFIKACSDLGLLASFSNWALEEACRQVKSLHRKGFEHLNVAVNTAPRQLLDPQFPHQVQAVLDATGLPPESLELEITENMMLAGQAGLRKRLFKLKDLGVSLSLDDFGIGYSSLTHLQRLPVDVIKIDRSFVQGLTKTSTDDAIVISVIELSRKLGVKVIAEGVETVEQLQFLQNHGCDGVQGYLFCRPLPAEDLVSFLDHPHGAGCPACDPERWARCRLAGLGLVCPMP